MDKMERAGDTAWYVAVIDDSTDVAALLEDLQVFYAACEASGDRFHLVFDIRDGGVGLTSSIGSAVSFFRLNESISLSRLEDTTIIVNDVVKTMLDCLFTLYVPRRPVEVLAACDAPSTLLDHVRGVLAPSKGILDSPRIHCPAYMCAATSAKP